MQWLIILRGVSSYGEMFPFKRKNSRRWDLNLVSHCFPVLSFIGMGQGARLDLHPCEMIFSPFMPESELDCLE